MRNKGFSLVELIIVIAIMAILSAAIVPALIRYINKAKKADDIAAADSIGTMFQAAITEDEFLYECMNYYAADTISDVSEDGTNKVSAASYSTDVWILTILSFLVLGAGLFIAKKYRRY